MEDKREASIELLKVEHKIIERSSDLKWKKKTKENKSLSSSRWKRKEKIELEGRLTKGGESITAVALTESLGDLLAVVSP